MTAQDKLRRQRLKEIQAFRKHFAKGVSATALHNALEQIFQYNLKDEEEDFLLEDHTADLEKHIFGALIVVEEYLRYQR